MINHKLIYARVIYPLNLCTSDFMTHKSRTFWRQIIALIGWKLKIWEI